MSGDRWARVLRAALRNRLLENGDQYDDSVDVQTLFAPWYADTEPRDRDRERKMTERIHEIWRLAELKVLGEGKPRLVQMGEGRRRKRA